MGANLMDATDSPSERKTYLDELFERANRQYDVGRFASAFQLFLKAAEAGDPSSQLALGNLYIDGVGVKRDRDTGMHWYRRAYRHGDGAAAYNIGIVYRDENKLNRAIGWFARAAKSKIGDANLEIAKIYLLKSDRDKATKYLKKIRKATREEVTEAGREEAAKLLKKL